MIMSVQFQADLLSLANAGEPAVQNSPSSGMTL